MDFIKSILKKKLVLAVVGLAVIGGGYYGYKALNAEETEPQYVLGTVEKGTLSISVSGTGQVSSSNEVEIKPQAAGEVLSVSVKAGQEVSPGTVIAQLDPKDARNAVRDAQINLESAKIALQKLQQSTNTTEVLQAENSVSSAQQSLEKVRIDYEDTINDNKRSQEKAQETIDKTYEDVFNKISDVFLDMPTIMNNLGTISEYKLEQTVWDDRDKLQVYINAFKKDEDTAEDMYRDNFNNYKDTSRYSSQEDINELLEETIATTKAVAQAVKSEINLLDAWNGYVESTGSAFYNEVQAHRTELSTYSGQINNHLSELLSSQITLKDSKDSLEDLALDLSEAKRNYPYDLASAERTVQEKQLSLTEAQTGTDPLDIKSQELVVQQRQNALNDAREELADYTVTAPIAGVLAAVDIKKGDTASTSTAAATIITKQKLAELSLNEVDVVKLKVGQKATLTFDAIEELSISGSVVEIDALGTAEQGVVSYKVKIGMDTEDERIKPGMSTSAFIITELKQDVLLVPSSAVKTDGDTSYVEVLVDGEPQAKIIIAGATNDTDTEIYGDIQEGDQIITQTIQPTSSSQTQTQQSGGSAIPGLGGGTGGFRTGGGAGAAGGGFPR